MESDEQLRQKEEERRRLLEEIQKRAEEAELKRIEEEERKGGFSRTPTPPKPEEPSPQDVPEQNEHLIGLQERLSHAIDRAKLETALPLYSELKSLAPNDPAVLDLERRLARLYTIKEEPEDVAPASDAVVPPPPSRDREVRTDKISRLLESANALYLQEKYDMGLEVVDEILSIDPDSDEAFDLRKRIEKSKRLAAQIREDEKRRKEEAASRAETSPSAPEKKLDEKEIWASEEPVPKDDLAVQEDAGVPKVPPPPPLIVRIAEKLSRVHIPVRKVFVGVVIAAVAVLGYLIIESIRTAVFPPKYSLLILPATPQAGDPTMESIAGGLTDHLVTDFESLAELRLIAPFTAFALRDSRLDDLQLARTIGANFFLSWSITGDVNTVGIEASLYDTLSTTPLWTSTYQVTMRELPATRLEIARKLVETIGLDLSLQEEAVLNRQSGGSAEAYAAFLRGRFMLRHLDRFNIQSAIEVLESALTYEPAYADAHSSLAWAHVLAYDSGVDTTRSRIEKAWYHVRRAVETTPVMPESYRAWGMVEQFRSEFVEALKNMELAVGMAPGDAESQRRLAVLYAIKQRPGDALKAAERAVADDPMNVGSHMLLGHIHQMRSDYASALQSYEIGLRYADDRSEYAGGHYADMLVYLQKPEQALTILNDRVASNRMSYVDLYRLGRVGQTAGRPKQEWQSTLERAKKLLLDRVSASPDNARMLSYLALVHIRLGEFKDAAAASQRALSLAASDFEVLYNTARMHALRRENEKALEFLALAADKKYDLSRILDMDYYNLRTDPGFQRAVTH